MKANDPTSGGAPCDPAPAVPSNARCRGCGYLLRDLPSSTCPECGRPFDPNDPATFDSNPARRRRRRLLGLVCLLVLIAAAGTVLRPRQSFTSTLTWTCHRCGESINVTRTQWIGPAWVPFDYPGYTWRSQSPAALADASSDGAAGANATTLESSHADAADHLPVTNADAATTADAVTTADADTSADAAVCPPHAFGLHLDIKTVPKGGMYLPLPTAANSDVFLNGQLLTPDTAGPILHQVMTAGGGITLKIGPRRE